MKANWPKVPLQKVLRRRAPDVTVEPTEIYEFAGVYSFGRGVFRAQARQGSEFAYRYLTRLRKDEFVYPKLMAWEGAFGIVPVECDGRCVSPEFPVFEIDTERLSPVFMGFYFRIPQVWESISGGSTGTNVRRRRLHPDTFLRREMPLPPLAEQERVVTRIEQIAAHVREAEALRREEEYDIRQILQGAFRLVTRDTLRRPMREVAPLVRRPVQVDQWCTYPELGIRSFGKGTFHKPALRGIEIGEKRIFRIEPGDLLFSNVFAWEGAIAVAKPEDADRVGSHRFITCVPRPGVATAHFLRFFFLTNEGLELVRTASPGGAGRNRTLGLTALESIDVPVPAIEDQRWFDALEAEFDALTRLHAETTAELDALLPTILDRAFKENL
jgi:type I restriction enzyme, S subunit